MALCLTYPIAQAEPIDEAYGFSGQCFKCVSCGLTSILPEQLPDHSLSRCQYCGELHSIEIPG